jgi:hypothetical protein
MHFIDIHVTNADQDSLCSVGQGPRLIKYFVQMSVLSQDLLSPLYEPANPRYKLQTKQKLGTS